MRFQLFFVVICMTGPSALSQEERIAEKRYEFPKLGWAFSTIGDRHQEVMTPRGRRLVAESEIQEIRQYGENVYLVSQYFIRRYDQAQDWAVGEKKFEDVFLFFYQTPQNHEILGQLWWYSREQWYYTIYFRGDKERPSEKQTLVFRGLVRIYPLPQETRVQYLPYLRLPEEGQWMATLGYAQNRRRFPIALENRFANERRLIVLNERDEFTASDE